MGECEKCESEGMEELIIKTPNLPTFKQTQS